MPTFEQERKEEALQFFHALKKSAEEFALEQVFNLGYCCGYTKASKDFRGIKTRNE